MTRALIIMGTRPEAIKLAPVVLAARASDEVEPVVLSTGQHREIFQDILDLYGFEADLQADVMRHGQSLSQLSARCLREFEPLLAEADPDIVVVQGDTTSAAMGALSAFYAGVPVWHVEAGLRTSTPRLPFPEEMNRRLIGRLAEVHLPPTAIARENLLAEGIAEDAIVQTGNTGIDALLLAVGMRDGFEDAGLAAITEGDGPLVVATTHRRENWGEGIQRIAGALADLLDRFPDLRVVHAAHPNPAVRADVEAVLGDHPRALIPGPVGYGDFARLLSRATIIISDSGGIQEEAPSLGVPVLVAREETERVEGVEAGLSRLVGSDRELIVDEAVRLLTDPDAREAMRTGENPYGDGRAAERIIAEMRVRAVDRTASGAA
ncbi:MAG TPA: UDP-N-acetylglucosamine 2-epimerase (non-hydrolyzing) [Miltoncostaea sp.]|nr:UDP-N-acetylglucosamine 2-epimerase (non-hydrolyzing) [Miltoncostaea sp.]